MAERDPKFCECQLPQHSVEGPLCITCKKPIVGQGDSPTIPLEMTELCRKVLELCKDAGCYSVTLDLNPGWRASFHSQIHVQWSSGRHGAPSRCVIETKLLTHLEV